MTRALLTLTALALGVVAGATAAQAADGGVLTQREILSTSVGAGGEIEIVYGKPYRVVTNRSVMSTEQRGDGVAVHYGSKEQAIITRRAVSVSGGENSEVTYKDLSTADRNRLTDDLVAGLEAANSGMAN